MAHQPDDGQPEHDHQDKKDDSAFAPFLAQRFAASAGAAIVPPAGILQRDRNIEPAAPFARPVQQLLALPPRRFLRHPRRFRDHALEFFHLTAQLGFALRVSLLRGEMEKLERMIAEAPRVAEETTRRQREELLERASEGRSRLDVSVALQDTRWGNEGRTGGRRKSLRKERREGRIIFLVLVIALGLLVIWLVSHLHL
ncbi:MAG: hypothetical protein QOF80_1078 [Verrucomicrobiota bacterium]